MTFDARLHNVVNAQPFPLVFVTISGAHLYGFASADSDYDLRGTHVLPAREMLKLNSRPDTIERSDVVDGLEIDLVTHDIAKFMRMLLKKNGYVLEQVFSPLVLYTTSEHEELKSIAQRCVTKFHAYHYLGFSETQWKLFAKETPPRVKPLLYLYRVLLTGIHLMRTGMVEANLVKLNEHYKLPQIPELIDAKVNGVEKQKLVQIDLAFHEREYQRLRTRLQEEMNRSQLRETTNAPPALDDLLVRMRLASL